MRKLVINIQKGGLGDHLFYSHIPRIAKETGAYHQVFISNRSIFRHPDYKRLVWEMNPYLDGFTDEEGIYHFAKKVSAGENLLDRLMLLYGMDDGNRFHEPELYYQPEKKPGFENSVIYDPNFISYTGDLTTGKLIADWFNGQGISVNYQMKKLNHRYLSIDAPILETGSLLDFCSLLISCRRMYCLTTGTATIAAALNVPVTVFYGTGHDPLYRHSGMHDYVHVGSDYRWKEKIKKRIVLFLGKFFKMGVS